jgi:hypothetical protein
VGGREETIEIAAIAVIARDRRNRKALLIDHFRTNWIALRARPLSAVVLLLSLSAFEQVQISIPQAHYKPHDIIDVVITNTSKQTVSFCVEFGHWSYRETGELETTPTPVYVQSNDRGRWSTLPIGPDIGSIRHFITAGPGESQHYPFRLSGHGQVRIMLDYWIGENDRTCERPKGRKTAKSRVFVVE